MSVKLKGENQIRKFRRVAEELVSSIVRFDNVVGVVFLGGLARGFVDKFSDLDITVFLDRKDEQVGAQIHKIGLNLSKHYNVGVDLEVHLLDEFRKWKLGEADKWYFAGAEIVFDPKGEVRKVFEEKLKVSKSFWFKRLVICSEYIKWYCCPLKENEDCVAEAWIERDDLVTAHYCLNYAVDLLLKIIFALNREFLPAPKWRLFYSYGLKWLPKGYKELVKEALCVKDFSASEFERRLKAIRTLWREVAQKIEQETGLKREQLSKCYVEKVLHQTFVET
ncbi:MAG: nucleotidyltransferase domain-containing protein [Candidatus Bathyarchaeia archaeon]